MLIIQLFGRRELAEIRVPSFQSGWHVFLKVVINARRAGGVILFENYFWQQTEYS